MPKTPRPVGQTHSFISWNSEKAAELGVHLDQFCKDHHAKKWAFQVERGEQSGLLHLQGKVNWKTPFRPWETFEGYGEKQYWAPSTDSGKKTGYDYGLKDETAVDPVNLRWQHGITEKDYKVKIQVEWDATRDEITLYGWQLELRDILIKTRPDRRIYWYWSKSGQMGKTSFQTWFEQNVCGVHHARGCMTDVMNGIINSTSVIRIVFWNLPREATADGVSYQAMEAIKDGLVTNTKYEVKSVFLDLMHVVVFANIPPNEERLSADRWVIKEIV